MATSTTGFVTKTKSTLTGKKDPIINNLTIPLASTEYSFAIPIGTKEFQLRNTSGRSIKFSFTPGGSSAAPLTLMPWVSETIAELDDTLTLYYQAPSLGATFDVLSWS